MAKTAGKTEYNVIIHHRPKTAEEEEAHQRKVANILLDAKLIAMGQKKTG